MVGKIKHYLGFTELSMFSFLPPLIFCPCAFSSYSGYEWEGIPPSPIHPKCSSKGCSVNFIDKAYAYRIDALDRPVKRDSKFDTARFLAQTTFGASKSDLKEFESKYTAST